MIKQSLIFVGLIVGWCGMYIGVRGLLEEFTVRSERYIPKIVMVLLASSTTSMIVNITFFSVVLIMQ